LTRWQQGRARASRPTWHSPVDRPQRQQQIPRAASAEEIPKTGIDDHKASEDQRHRKPWFCLRTAGVPGAGVSGAGILEPGILGTGVSGSFGGGAFECRDVSARSAGDDRLNPDVGRFASAAHLPIVAFVDELDDGLGSLRLGLFLQHRPVSFKKRLCLRGQGGATVQFRHHVPGRKIGSCPGIGASRDHHVGSFDHIGLWCCERLRRARLVVLRPGSFAIVRVIGPQKSNSSGALDLTFAFRASSERGKRRSDPLH